MPWRGIDPTEKGRHWAIPRFVGALVKGKDTLAALDALDAAGRIHWLARSSLLWPQIHAVVGRVLADQVDFANTFLNQCAHLSGDGRVILLVDPSRLTDQAWAGRAGEARAARAQAAARARREPQGRRVLLVDDSVSIRKFVGKMLERAGFEVLTATDGAEALRRLAESSVDAVITDLEMPRVSGYELIEDMRSRAATRALPVVVLTTRAGAKHVSLARRLGITHYVTKPVDEDAFVRLVDSLTARVSGAEAASTAPSSAPCDRRWPRPPTRSPRPRARPSR